MKLLWTAIARRLDATFPPGPEDLVHLELEAYWEAVPQNPLRELARFEARRDLVSRRRGGEEDRLGLRGMVREDVLRELVVPAVHQDDLHFVVVAQQGHVRERLRGLHAVS